MEINPQNKKIFDKIFTDNKWGDRDSKSGSGSNFHQTDVLRKTLPNFFLKHKIKSVLDVPCGDFHWMKEIKDSLNKVVNNYVGADIVDEIITANNLKYGDSKFRFQILDITVSALPTVDIILCRDCLVHLSYHNIYRAIKSIKKSRSKYLLTTSFTGNNRRNKDVFTGGWRPLNFQKFPFYFPIPDDIIIENCTENGGIYQDKSLLLWKVDKLDLYFLNVLIIFSKFKNTIKKCIRLFS